MDDVVCLGGEHALYVVLHITEDNTIPLASGSSIGLSRERLDLKALQDRYGELGVGGIGIGEDQTDGERHD